MDDGIEDITEATAAAQIAAAQNQFGNGASANGGQKEYGYGGVDLVKAPQTLKTIEDALMSVANDCTLLTSLTSTNLTNGLCLSPTERDTTLLNPTKPQTSNPKP